MLKGIWTFIGIVILAIILALVVWSYARAEFKSNFNYSSVMEAKSAVFIMHTEAKLPSGYKFGPFRAICFSIGDGYIVALSHATNLSKMFPRAIYTDETYWIGDDELELVGRYEDISLFKSYMYRYSIPFGDSDELRFGTYVVVLGYSLAKVINIKDGIVTRPVIRDEFASMSGMLDASTTFMTNAPLNPGDSGGMVIAFNGDKPEVIGIACIAIQKAKGMNFAFKSRYVQEAIATIKEE